MYLQQGLCPLNGGGHRDAHFCLKFAHVVYQGPNQTNQDSIQAWLKHEEPNSTRQQQ